jgi:hypothetical protein
MQNIDALDDRTPNLGACAGLGRRTGAQHRRVSAAQSRTNRIAPIRRLLLTLSADTAGLGREAKAHVLSCLRLSRLDSWVGGSPISRSRWRALPRMPPGRALGRAGDPIASKDADPARDHDRLRCPGRRSAAGTAGAGNARRLRPWASSAACSAARTGVHPAGGHERLLDGR